MSTSPICSFLNTNDHTLCGDKDVDFGFMKASEKLLGRVLCRCIRHMRYYIANDEVARSLKYEILAYRKAYKKTKGREAANNFDTIAGAKASEAYPTLQQNKYTVEYGATLKKLNEIEYVPLPQVLSIVDNYKENIRRQFTEWFEHGNLVQLSLEQACDQADQLIVKIRDDINHCDLSAHEKAQMNIWVTDNYKALREKIVLIVQDQN